MYCDDCEGSYDSKHSAYDCMHSDYLYDLEDMMHLDYWCARDVGTAIMCPGRRHNTNKLCPRRRHGTSNGPGTDERSFFVFHLSQHILHPHGIIFLLRQDLELPSDLVGAIAFTIR